MKSRLREVGMQNYSKRNKDFHVGESSYYGNLVVFFKGLNERLNKKWDDLVQWLQSQDYLTWIKRVTRELFSNFPPSPRSTLRLLLHFRSAAALRDHIWTGRELSDFLFKDVLTLSSLYCIKLLLKSLGRELNQIWRVNNLKGMPLGRWLPNNRLVRVSECSVTIILTICHWLTTLRITMVTVIDTEMDLAFFFRKLSQRRFCERRRFNSIQIQRQIPRRTTAFPS